MKKKLLISLFVCLIVIFALAICVSAEEANCEHNYSKWTIELSSAGFLGDITAKSSCTVCKAETTEIIPRLFITLGYSSSSNGVLQGYGVNRAAIERYQQLSGEKIKFGAVVAVKAQLIHRSSADRRAYLDT